MNTSNHKQELKDLVEEIQEFNIVLYAFLYKANIIWSTECKTAAVSVKKGRATFYFNEEFWNTLTIQEKMFLLLHECYHVFLRHFVRFNTFDSITNIALDIADNHSILRHFNFTDDQLPYIRKNCCWCDNVIPGQVLLDSLSAEEYLFILKQQPSPPQYTMFDDHSDMSEQDMENVFDQLKEDLKELFPDKDDKEIKDLLSSFKTETEAAGQGLGEDVVVAPLKKRKQTWVQFAKKLQQQLFSEREDSVWLPNKRLRHLESEGMFIPSVKTEDLINKINVVLLLDTSGSCISYIPHFLGFAKAIPSEFFNLHVYGFNTDYYKIDLEDPIFKDGGTCFKKFQKIFDEVPGKKIAFVFTDGAGTPCTLEYPPLWNWFLFLDDACLDYIPKDSHIFFLDHFE